MLGGECSVCCGKCGCSPPAKLPYTMTVTFSGLLNKTHGNYCDLTIASAIGSGAAGVATSPGGCDGASDSVCGKFLPNGSGGCSINKTYDPSDRGPLTGVLLTSPGSDYTVNRSPPTLAVGGGSGDGADFEVTLKEEFCEWSVESISVSGGEGYADNDSLTITAGADDTVASPAEARLRTGRGEPTLTASVPSGAGAVFSITYTKLDGPPPTWSIASVNVIDGGSGHQWGDIVTLTLGEGDNGYGAYAEIRTGYIEPTLSASVAGAGAGAVLGVSLGTGSYGTDWAVTAISVTSGGSGYLEGDEVVVSVDDGQGGGAFAVVGSVNEDGAVLSIQVYSGGSYFKDGGVVQSVYLLSGGEYFKDTGVPESVEVVEPGAYYRVDPDAEPCADITVTPCGGGYGAEISAQVDLDKSSATYGQITGLTIENGGSDYLAWRWIETCREKLNGIPYVLKANTPEPLIRLSFQSCYGGGARAHVTAIGSRVAPELELFGDGRCGTITPSLSSSTDQSDTDGACPQQYWTIDSVEASGGWGYADGEQASIDYNGATVIEGADVELHATGASDPPKPAVDGALTGATVDAGGKFYLQKEWDGTPSPIRGLTIDDAGSGYAKIGREQPHLSFSGSATFTPTFSQHQDSCGIDYWTLESVAVSGGGCYGTRAEPTLTATAPGESAATLAVQMSKTWGTCGQKYWGVDSVSVTGGDGYEPGWTPVTFSAPDSVVTISPASASLYAGQDGVPAYVHVSDGGRYFAKGADEQLLAVPATTNDKVQTAAVLTVQTTGDGVPTGVTVVKKGVYYRENKSLPPYVADVEVTINQTLPSNGSGAEITATVGDDPNDDATFGTITKLTIVNCGSGYQPLGGPLNCRYEGPCNLALQFNGKGQKAELTIDDAVFRTDDTLEDCNSLPSFAPKFHSIGEGEAQISPGGSWDSDAQLACCGGYTPCAPGTSGAPPLQTCGQNDTQFSCTGDCDNCNQCDSGCGCKNGKCTPCCGPCDENNLCPNGCPCVDGECRPPCSIFPCPPSKPCCVNGECVAGMGGFIGLINWLAPNQIDECVPRPFEFVGPGGTCVLPFDEGCGFGTVGAFDTAIECFQQTQAAVAAFEAQQVGFSCFGSWSCGFVECGAENPLP